MEGVGQGDDNVDVPAVSRHGRVELESVAALSLRLALAQEERRAQGTSAILISTVSTINLGLHLSVVITQDLIHHVGVFTTTY